MVPLAAVTIIDEVIKPGKLFQFCIQFLGSVQELSAEKNWTFYRSICLYFSNAEFKTLPFSLNKSEEEMKTYPVSLIQNHLEIWGFLSPFETVSLCSQLIKRGLGQLSKQILTKSTNET